MLLLMVLLAYFPLPIQHVPEANVSLGLCSRSTGEETADYSNSHCYWFGFMGVNPIYFPLF